MKKPSRVLRVRIPELLFQDITKACEMVKLKKSTLMKHGTIIIVERILQDQGLRYEELGEIPFIDPDNNPLDNS